MTDDMLVAQALTRLLYHLDCSVPQTQDVLRGDLGFLAHNASRYGAKVVPDMAHMLLVLQTACPA